MGKLATLSPIGLVLWGYPCQLGHLFECLNGFALGQNVLMSDPKWSLVDQSLATIGPLRPPIGQLLHLSPIKGLFD